MARLTEATTIPLGWLIGAAVLTWGAGTTVATFTVQAWAQDEAQDARIERLEDDVKAAGQITAEEIRAAQAERQALLRNVGELNGSVKLLIQELRIRGVIHETGAARRAEDGGDG